MPWTHRRLGRATGYGAGVASPGWYDHVFRHPGPEGVARFFVDAAHALRRRGMPASPDHLIAASRARRRRWPCCAAGRAPGSPRCSTPPTSVLGGLPLVVDELVVGDAIGEVPPEAPQVPLARDLAAAQRAARLQAGGRRRAPIELDLRTPNGLRRSHLLHRLVALGVPWGTLEEGAGSSGTFRETWRAGVGARAVGARSSSWPATAPRSRRRRRRGSSSGSRQAGRLGRRRRRRRPGAARRSARRRRAGRRACSARWPPTIPTSPS